MGKSTASETFPDDTRLRRRTGLRAGLWIAAAGLLIFSLALYGFAATQLAGEPATLVEGPAALMVPILRVEPQQGYEVRRTFVGRVEATQESPVGFELGGFLQEVRVDEGDAVKTGQLLARLDHQRLQAQRRELVAALNEAKANLALTKITVNRFEGVVKAGGVTAQALDEAREKRRAAQAAVELASTRIQTIEVDLGKSELRAPFDALVTERSVDQGRVLGAGEPVLRLQQRGPREVRVGVAGRFADAIAVGQLHPVQVGGDAFQAEVKAVLPVRSSGTRTVDVILALGAGSEELRAGDLARLELTEIVVEAGYWLPLAALAEGTRGLWTSYVAEPLDGQQDAEALTGATHRLVPHILEILHEESDRVFARGTLQQGDLIVAAGLHRVVPGQQVRLADDPES